MARPARSPTCAAETTTVSAWFRPAALDEKVWRQVTAVYDGSLPMTERTKIYLDGALDVTGGDFDTTIPNTTSAIHVGCQFTGVAAEHFVGQLDDIIMWTRALSASEVADWYALSR